jgi:hypothetical protein
VLALEWRFHCGASVGAQPVEEIVHRRELLACAVQAGKAGRGHEDPGLTESYESWKIEETIDLRDVSDEQDHNPLNDIPNECKKSMSRVVVEGMVMNVYVWCLVELKELRCVLGKRNCLV